MAGLEDLVQRTGDDRTGRVIGGRTIERSGGVVYGLHRTREDEKRRFLGWASKPTPTICQWFAIKTIETVFSGLTLKSVATVLSALASKLVVMVSPGLVSKPVARVSWFWPQNRQLWFGDLYLKITATVS
jgi:hypothetical protein